MWKQLNYTCMLKNLLKLYCIWTWDTWWALCVCVCSFIILYVSLWWDSYRRTSEALSQGLDAEGRTPKLLRLKFQCIWTWRFLFFIFYFVLFYCILYIYICIYTFISFIYFLNFYSYLYSFYFLFSILSCLSNAFSAYGWLVHCLCLYLWIFLFVFCFVFSSAWLFVFPFSFNFSTFHPLSPFHSKYH
jgi:hypothetical protein